MRGKRGYSRFYASETQPRKRQKENGDNLVHLNFDVYADDLRMYDVVAYINQTMKREFSSSVGRDDAVLRYNADKDGKGWILEAASADLAKKVCNLDGIYFKYHPLKIQKYGTLSSPSSWCWNDYYLKRHGKNSHFVDHHIVATVLKSEGIGTGIAGSMLQNKLNETMQEFKLASTNAITETVRWKRGAGNDNQFLLNVRTRQHATRLTYLNCICIDKLPIALTRLPEWKGEEPRYKHYEEFLEDFHSDEVKRAQSKKEVKRKSIDRAKMDEHQAASTDSDDEEASNSFASSPPSAQANVNVVHPTNGGEMNPFWEIYQGQPTETVVASETLTLVGDHDAVQELNSQPDVEKGASATITIQEDEDNVEIAANDSFKTIIAKQVAPSKALLDSLEIAKENLAQQDSRITELEAIVQEQKEHMEEARARKEILAKKTSVHIKLLNQKVAQKDELISQLENIVEGQRTDIDFERRQVSSKAMEICTLQKNLAFQKKDMEEQGQLLKIKEEEMARIRGDVEDLSKKLDSTITTRDEIHQDWGNQALLLKGKDKEIAALKAKLEKGSVSKKRLVGIQHDLDKQISMNRAKDKQMAALEAKLEKLRDAFLWQPDMDVNDKAEMQKKWKETIES